MKHRVVVVGAGFAGLQFVQGLKGAGCDITLIDQRNHHLFQPLLYQVATTLLATSEIAWPIRRVMRSREDVTTLLATVTGIDRIAREVILDDGTHVPFDTLAIATGARHAYFGNDHWEADAPGLKTLEDATTIRRRLLLAFERAELTHDEAEREAQLTFAVWRDYAMSFTRDFASFAAFRRTAEHPQMRVEKRPSLRGRQGMWALFGEHGQVLKRGHELAGVLAPVERRLLKVVSG